MGGLLDFIRASVPLAAEARAGYLQGQDQEADKQRAQARQDRLDTRADAALQVQQQREAETEKRGTLMTQMRDMMNRGNLKKLGIVPQQSLGDTFDPSKHKVYGAVNGETFVYDPEQDSDLADRQALRSQRTAHATNYLSKGAGMTDDEAVDFQRTLEAQGATPERARAATIAFRRGDHSVVNPIVNPPSPRLPTPPNPSVEQGRQLSTLNTQIGDAGRRSSGFQRQADAAEFSVDPKVEAARPALRDSVSKWNATRDSLTKKRDSVAALQTGGQPVGLSNAAPAVSDPRARATGQRVSSAAGQLSPSDQQAMQREFDEAGDLFKSVLDSNAPSEAKQQARSLYDQHLRGIASRYGVVRP